MCNIKKNFQKIYDKYVPPNIDNTNFKNSVITNKNYDEKLGPL